MGPPFWVLNLPGPPSRDRVGGSERDPETDSVDPSPDDSDAGGVWMWEPGPSRKRGVSEDTSVRFSVNGKLSSLG